MDGMMNEPLSDDVVIARLRSALDEVAASASPEGARDRDAPVVHLGAARSDRRPTRVWLAVAAASVVLVGAGAWVLGQRTSPPTAGGPTTEPGTDTTASGPATGGAPVYEIRLADAVRGDSSADATDDGGGAGFTQTWWIDGSDTARPRGPGFLIVHVSDEQLDLPPDPAASSEVAGAPEGRAWFLGDVTSTGADDTLQLVWQRADGTVWQATQVGLVAGSSPESAAAFADEVFGLQTTTFNDLLTNPAPDAEWLGVGAAGTSLTSTDEYGVGGEATVTLTISNHPTIPALIGLLALTPDRSVAGHRAWSGLMPDGSTEVAWQDEGGWWGVLTIDASLLSRVDEIIAAVTPIGSDTTPTTTAQATTPTEPAPRPADAPAYVLDGLTPESNGTMPVSNGEAVLRSAVWAVDQTGVGAPTAYVFATAMDWGGMPFDADGVNYIDVSRNGVDAVLEKGISAGTEMLDPKVYLPQADGVVWVFEAANLAGAGDDPFAPLVDLAFALSNDAVTAGIDPAIPSNVSLVGEGPRPTTEWFDTFTTPNAGMVAISVSDGFVAQALRHATDVRAATVFGRPALVGTQPDGPPQVVWQTDEGSTWWATLTFRSDVDATTIDSVIASVRAVSPPAP